MTSLIHGPKFLRHLGNDRFILPMADISWALYKVVDKSEAETGQGKQEKNRSLQDL